VTVSNLMRPPRGPRRSASLPLALLALTLQLLPPPSSSSSAAPPASMWPTVSLGGGLEASCHCRAAGAAAAPTGGEPPPPPPPACALRSVTLAVAGAASPAAEAAARAHVGDASALRLAAAASTPLACGEQSGSDEVAGSWGGDAGELVLSAGAVERVLLRPLHDAETARLARAYVERLRAPLVYHTSAAAVARLAAAAGVEALDLLSPPAAARPALLRALAAPESHGCALLRALLRAGGAGGVRPALAADIVRALHGILWDEGDALRRRIRYYVDASTPAELAAAVAAAGAPPVAQLPVARQAPDGSALPANAAAGAGAGAPLPYGRLAGVLTMPPPPPRGAQPQPWRLALDAAGGAAARDAAAPLAPAPPPTALLVVTVAPACAKLDRAPLLAPHVPQPLGAPPRPSFLVLHPQAVAARRNATVPLIATAFKLNGDELRDAMASIAADWDAAVEAALGVGGPALPKVTVLLQ
jgi:hypothetical protein